VLSRALLERAMATMDEARIRGLLEGMRALIEADRQAPPRRPGPTHSLHQKRRRTP
jgi:hypothetical protein